MPGTLRQRAVTAHFISHWGVPSEIHLQESARFDLAVIEFAPARGRMTYRFATNGMSKVVQSSRGGRYRTEIFASSRSGSPWIVRLLAALAAHPIEEETSLGELQTVPLAGPIVCERSVFTAVLIAPPERDDPETVGAILGVTPEPILVHQVVAISDQERKFAVERGSEALWHGLLGLDRPLLLDEARPDAVRDSGSTNGRPSCGDGRFRSPRMPRRPALCMRSTPMDDGLELARAEALYRQGVPSLGPALAALIHHWRAGTRDEGTIIRLLFLIWYRMVEPLTLTGLPEEYTGPSFEEVFESAGGEPGASPRILWAVGQMAHLSPWAVGDESRWSEAAGRLLDRARQLRPNISAVDFAGLGAAADYFGHLVERITAAGQERAKE